MHTSVLTGIASKWNYVVTISANLVWPMTPPRLSVYTLGNGVIAVVTKNGYEEFNTFKAAKEYIDKICTSEGK